MKPITLYWRIQHTRSDVSTKVLIILEELGLPYQTSSVDGDDVKKEPFVNINPNGKAPAICDPNSGMTLWESTAINDYLVNKYDTERRLTYQSEPEQYQIQQWLHFQSSGQGPYFGQTAWFNIGHPEKLPTAQARYGNEIRRVVGVLNHVLANRTWLVRDKCTYADLAFVTWNNSIDYALKGGPTAWDINEFPNFKRWQEAMLDWDSVKKAVGVMAEKEVRSEGRLHVGNGELERGLGHHQS